jgi:hypothetical protein
VILVDVAATEKRLSSESPGAGRNIFICPEIIITLMREGMIMSIITGIPMTIPMRGCVR